MDLGLKGKLALVTGSSKNIGRAIAFSLAKEGARVILTGRDAASLQAAALQLSGSGLDYICINQDLQESDGPRSLVDKITRQCGEPDIVVHNLGGSMSITDPSAPRQKWADVWNYNLGISIDLNTLLIPSMVAANWGRILHISTLSTQTATGHPAYVSAKCALEGYVKSLSKTVSANNVLINCLAPGLIDVKGRYFSKMKDADPHVLTTYFEHHLPIRRMGSIEEIGNIAALLCSEQASYMAGAIIRIDGGGH